ncbi:MAG: ornithine carbamoyltransferase [Dissulfurispiraceae bacterium]
MKRDFVTLWDLTGEEIQVLIKRAIDLKSGADLSKRPLIGKSVALFFEKPSTRTRISFEVGIYQLGGQSLYLQPKDMQLGRGETLSDTARVLSRYVSGVILRTYLHSSVEEFACHATIPIINGLSNLHHPCQALADLMTIVEKKGKLTDTRLAYIGDGNNVANSLIEAAAKTGINLALACPAGYEPDSNVLARAKGKGAGRITLLRDPQEAADGADVIYADVWVSMGQEGDSEKRRSIFKDFQINDRLLSYAKQDAIVLHCLPAHRGEEITDNVIDGPRSAVFDQAENRLHTAKAVLEFLIS